MLEINMKISHSKIKKWGFKQRLFEIKKRVDMVWDDPELSKDSTIILSEAQQIIDYWIKHMEGPVDKKETPPVKPHKKKKIVNLWEDVL